MFQTLDDQFRECEVLQKDPSDILTNEKHRYVSNQELALKLEGSFDECRHLLTNVNC
jgi:hypothetical protein